jgi:hypothetical protein
MGGAKTLDEKLIACLTYCAGNEKRNQFRFYRRGMRVAKAYKSRAFAIAKDYDVNLPIAKPRSAYCCAIKGVADVAGAVQAKRHTLLGALGQMHAQRPQFVNERRRSRPCYERAPYLERSEISVTGEFSGNMIYKLCETLSFSAYYLSRMPKAC